MWRNIESSSNPNFYYYFLEKYPLGKVFEEIQRWQPCFPSLAGDDWEGNNILNGYEVWNCFLLDSVCFSPRLDLEKHSNGSHFPSLAGRDLVKKQDFERDFRWKLLFCYDLVIHLFVVSVRRRFALCYCDTTSFASNIFFLQKHSIPSFH